LRKKLPLGGNYFENTASKKHAHNKVIAGMYDFHSQIWINKESIIESSMEAASAWAKKSKGGHPIYPLSRKK